MNFGHRIPAVYTYKCVCVRTKKKTSLRLTIHYCIDLLSQDKTKKSRSQNTHTQKFFDVCIFFVVYTRWHQLFPIHLMIANGNRIRDKMDRNQIACLSVVMHVPCNWLHKSRHFTCSQKKGTRTKSYIYILLYQSWMARLSFTMSFCCVTFH